MSFIFYDTETTGTETSFDQILQFAAIRTDPYLVETDRFEIRCRLSSDVVAAPGAVRVTKTRAAQLGDSSLPSHYEMMRIVQAKLLSWSPALFLGWNSIQFDEHLIRQALYKTLHNPYLTNRDGNTRTDVMRIVQACSVFAPEALVIPSSAGGANVFKLDQVAPANGFTHDKAHDAMGDVEATIFISRLLSERASNIWSSFMRYSSKAAVADFISEERIFCFSDFYFGKPYSFLVTTLGNNQENQAEWYVYDLRFDPSSIASLSASQLASWLNQSPKPIRKLKSNAVPMLCPADEAPTICGSKGLGMDVLEQRAEMLAEGSSLRQKLVSALESTKKQYAISVHVERQIYDKFIEANDETLMEEFHQAPWPNRHEIVQRFKDPRLQVLGKRLIHAERPDLLDQVTCHEHNLKLARRLLGQGDNIEWLTLPKALEEIELMLVKATGEELELLNEHKQHLRERHQDAMSVVAASALRTQ